MAHACTVKVTGFTVSDATYASTHTGTYLPFEVGFTKAEITAGGKSATPGRFGSFFRRARSERDDDTGGKSHPIGDGTIPDAARLVLRDSVAPSRRDAFSEEAVTYDIAVASFLCSNDFVVADGADVNAAMAKACGDFGRLSGQGVGERLEYSSHTFVEYSSMFPLRAEKRHSVSADSPCGVVCIKRNDTAALIVATELFARTSMRDGEIYVKGRKKVFLRDTPGVPRIIRDEMDNIDFPGVEFGTLQFFEPMAAFMTQRNGDVVLDTHAAYYAFVCSPPLVSVLFDAVNRCRAHFIDRLKGEADTSSLCMFCDVRLLPKRNDVDVSVSRKANAGVVSDKRRQLKRIVSDKKDGDLHVTMTMFANSENGE